VGVGSHHRFAAVGGHGIEDFGVAGCDDGTFEALGAPAALEHMQDHRQAEDRRQRFAGEPARRHARWNDADRFAHSISFCEPPAASVAGDVGKAGKGAAHGDDLGAEGE
jgi:hypothetical protein